MVSLEPRLRRPFAVSNTFRSHSRHSHTDNHHLGIVLELEGKPF